MGTTTTVVSGPSQLDQIQREIFSPTCALVGCHDASTQVQGLALTSSAVSRQRLVGVTSSCADKVYVVPFEPDQSYLIDKVGAGETPCGFVMPLIGAALSQEEITLIRDWIAAGAPSGSGTELLWTTSSTTSSSIPTTTSTTTLTTVLESD